MHSVSGEHLLELRHHLLANPLAQLTTYLEGALQRLCLQSAGLEVAGLREAAADRVRVAVVVVLSWDEVRLDPVAEAAGRELVGL